MKTDSLSPIHKYTPQTVKMEFRQTFTREFLRTARARALELERVQTITRWVEQASGQVLQCANLGKTQYTVEIRSTNGPTPSNYVPTTQELVEAFRIKFPDCRVEYEETWEASPRNPNQMNKKNGIIVDWS